MEFTHIDVFLEYYGKVRQRTTRLHRRHPG